MTLRIITNNVHIVNCGIGIDVAHGSDVEIAGSGLFIHQCETAILQRDPPSALSALGIPPDTPKAYIQELLSALGKIPENNIELRKAAVKSSRFWTVVQNSSNAATTLQVLSSAGPALIAGLSSIF